MMSHRLFGFSAAVLAATLLMATSVSAAPLFKVTEAFVGVPGADPTVDWFELTNFGDMSGNIGGYYYDDDSADPTENFQLPNFDVDPGESVIVLIEALDDPDTIEIDEEALNIAAFQSFWGSPVSGVQIGATDGGSLGGGGDAVNVFDSNFLLANLIDNLTYTSTLAEKQGTIEDVTGMGPLQLSVLGENGAFFSAGTTGLGNLIGSPGRIASVPEPASVVLVMLGAVGLLAARRR